MTPLRPIHGPAPLQGPARLASVSAPAAAAGPADVFRAGMAAAPAAPAPTPAAPPRKAAPQVLGILYQPAPKGGMEEVRVFPSSGDPVPVRDAQGNLSFVFPSQDGFCTRVQRVDSDGEVRWSLHLPPTNRESQVAVDPRGGRFYALSEGRLQAYDLADGSLLTEQEAAGGRISLEARPGGGLRIRTQDSLRLLDADLKVEREVAGKDPQTVLELPKGALAVQWGNRQALTVHDSSGKATATLEGGLRSLQAGPDGAVWGIAGDPWDSKAEVVRVDPSTGATRRLPGVRSHEGLYPRADGSYVVHSKNDLTAFNLHQFSPDGVEQREFHAKGNLEHLELSPDGDAAWGVVNDWQAKPGASRLVRFDLEAPARSLSSRIVSVLGIGDSGQEVYHENRSGGRQNHFVITALDGGRVAVAGQSGGSLLDRDGRTLKRYDSAEALARDVDPEGLGEKDLRRQAKILVPDLEADFGRSQGAFRGVGGLQFSRPASSDSLPDAAGLDAEANEARLKGVLFGREEVPHTPVGFPDGPGRFWVEENDPILVAEVPDPANPGAYQRKNYWLDEFDHYTGVLPVSVPGGQIVVATDNRGTVHWFDPARGADRQFPLPGARSIRQLDDHRILVTGDEGHLLVLETPGMKMLSTKDLRPEDQPRIISSESEVRVGSISLPKRSEG